MTVPQRREEQETLDKEVTHTLEEARMVLPGVQALFGFQLVAVYSARFDQVLSAAQQQIHLGSMLLTAFTVVLTMCPAAYHRQAEPHQVTRSFVKIASRLLMAGMATLMLSIWLDCYLICRVILKSSRMSLLSVGLFAVAHVWMWFVMPRLRRHAAQRE